MLRLPRSLRHALRRELRAYCHPQGDWAPSLRERLSGLDEAALQDLDLLDKFGEVIAQEHLARFPPPAQEELVEIKWCGDGPSPVETCASAIRGTPARGGRSGGEGRVEEGGEEA